ncbi:MAG: DUF4181 domain-containing protein, partial [Bacillota bacterium]
NKLIRKKLKVKKKKMFSYNHLNEKHKKIDWTIRGSFIILLLVSFISKISLDFQVTAWYLETHNQIIGFIILSEAVRAVMENRYAENSNDYKFTLIQASIIVFSSISIIATDFFGLIYW